MRRMAALSPRHATNATARCRPPRGDNANRGERHDLSRRLIHPIGRPDFVLGASRRCGLYGNDIKAVGGRKSADCAVMHRGGGAALRLLRKRLLGQIVHPQSRSLRSTRCAAWATVRHDVPTLCQRVLLHGQWSPGPRCKRPGGKRRERRASAAAVYLPAACANPGGLLAAGLRAVNEVKTAARGPSTRRCTCPENHTFPLVFPSGRGGRRVLRVHLP